MNPAELRQWAIDRAMTHLGADARFTQIAGLATEVITFISTGSVVQQSAYGMVWTEERVALLRDKWPSKVAALVIFHELNEMSGPPMKRGNMWQKAAALGLKRPPSVKGDAARRAGMIARQNRETLREAA